MAGSDGSWVIVLLILLLGYVGLCQGKLFNGIVTLTAAVMGARLILEGRLRKRGMNADL